MRRKPSAWANDVKAAFGYVPQGLQGLSGFFSAPLSGYNLPILENRPDATQDIRLVRARDQTGYAETFPPK